MTFEIALLLGIVGVAMVLFFWEVIPADVVAVGVMLSVAIAGLAPKEQIFAGFGSDTVIMILGLLILTAALERTGLVDMAGRAVVTHAGDQPTKLFWVVIAAACGLSAFMSNTATAAFFLPVVMGIAKKSGTSPAKLLMPLAFASILSSSVTVVSTSTNLVVSGLMTSAKMEPLGMFEMAPVGAPIAVLGLVYVYLSRTWIPDRVPATTLTDDFGLQAYLSEIVILPQSSLAGKSLREARIEELFGLQVLRILRNGANKESGEVRLVAPRPRTVVQEGDILIVEGSSENILKIKDAAGVEIKSDAKLGDPDLTDADIVLVKAVLLPGSPLIGGTLKRKRFRDRYGPQVLGINHKGVNVAQKISQTHLELGDLLLLQGRPEDIRRIHESGVVSVITPMENLGEVRARRGHAWLAAAIFVGVLALASLKVMSLPVAVMLGAFLAFVTGCIRPQEAYAAVEWKALILIGSILCLGAAMDHTGTAKYVASGIVAATGSGDPIWLLTVFFVLSVMLTQVMSNQAAAVVVLPVAIQAALQADLNPRTFAIMVAVASSCSYLTPLEPACLMVHGPGHYRFMDFVKIGAPLTVLIYLVAIVLVPWFWPVR